MRTFCAGKGRPDYGALYVKDSRYSESDNDVFLDIMEDYFAQPVELKK